MKKYSSEKDLYILAKELAYKFTLDKYKSFLIQHEIIQRDILDEPFGRFSRIMVKEEYIRETLMLLWPGEGFDELIKILYGEDVTPKSVNIKSTLLDDNTLSAEENLIEADRKKKMRIQRDYYEKGYSKERINDNSHLLINSPTSSSKNQKKSKLIKALITILSLPKYLGRFILDLMGRDKVQESTVLVMGWIIIIFLIFLAFGIVNVDALLKLKEVLLLMK